MPPKRRFVPRLFNIVSFRFGVVARYSSLNTISYFAYPLVIKDYLYDRSYLVQNGTILIVDIGRETDRSQLFIVTLIVTWRVVRRLSFRVRGRGRTLAFMQRVVSPGPLLDLKVYIGRERSFIKRPRRDCCRRLESSQCTWRGQVQSLCYLTVVADSNHELRIVPLTPELWPAFQDLLSSQGGPCSRCWCMYWRIGPGYYKRKPETNRSAFHSLVRSGPPPGLIALAGNISLGWCQLTPRDALPWLDHAWRLKGVGNEPVWSISCFYVRKGHRKKGISRRLLEAAIETARRNRVRLLEAYPLDARFTEKTASFTGYVSTFRRAGFKIVIRRVPPQPIMRLNLS